MKYLCLSLLAFIPHVVAFDTSAMKSAGGALIDGTEPVHSFEYVSNGNASFLVLNKEIGRKGNSAIWKYVDHLPIPDIDPDYSLYYAMCNLNGAFEPRIVAIAKLDMNKEINREVKEAWFANLELGKYQKIDTSNIECINEGYGL